MFFWLVSKLNYKIAKTFLIYRHKIYSYNKNYNFKHLTRQIQYGP